MGFAISLLYSAATRKVAGGQPKSGESHFEAWSWRCGVSEATTRSQQKKIK